MNPVSKIPGNIILVVEGAIYVGKAIKAVIDSAGTKIASLEGKFHFYVFAAFSITQ